MSEEDKLHYFNDEAASKKDLLLNMMKGQGYVPHGCLLGGKSVYALMNQGEDPCRGCNCDRQKCEGRPGEKT